MGKIFWKIFFGCWLTLLVTAAGVGITVYVYNENRWKSHTNISTSPLAELAIAATAATLKHGGLEAVQDLFASTRKKPSVLIIDKNGRDLFNRNVPIGIWQQLPLLELQSKTKTAIRDVIAPNGKEYLIFVPSAVMKKKHPIQLKLWHLQLTIGLFASLALSALLAWNFARPVRCLRQATKRLAAGDFKTRVVTTMGNRHDEFAQLGSDFDNMAEKLESLLNAQTRLLHDISHELRSPLSRLQLAAELLNQQPENKAMLNQISREVHRINTLINEILTLSRYEANASPSLETYVELGELVEEIVQDLKFEIQETKHELNFNQIKSGIIKGSAELLRRAIENVIRNALKYSPNHTAINIEINQNTTGWISLTICDNGPGINENFLETIFLPFFRLQNIAQGYGLGLTIAKRSVEVIGGKIFATNRENGGLCVEIQLPLIK